MKLIMVFKATLIGVLFLVVFFQVEGTGESCDNGKGVCIDVNTQQCFNGEGYLKPGYCPGPSNIICCEESMNIPDRCLGKGPSLLPNSYEFTLKNQGFDGHPGALVYVPSTFDKNKAKLDITVYIHGYQNCIQNIVRNVENACNCSAGGDVREAYNLIEQFESAATDPTRISAKDEVSLLFIAAEVAYDQSNDNPGRWAEQNVFRNYINELLTETTLPSIIGNYTLDSIDRIRIFSHSGGYYTIGNMAIVGGLSDKVKHLNLFDSLYADMPQFEEYIETNLKAFGTSHTEFRFTSLYTLDGGTYNNNVQFSAQSKALVEKNDCSEIYFNDNSNADELSVQEMQSYSLMYKLSAYSHNDMPRNYFREFITNTY